MFQKIRRTSTVELKRTRVSIVHSRLLNQLVSLLSKVGDWGLNRSFFDSVLLSWFVFQIIPWHAPRRVEMLKLKGRVVRGYFQDVSIAESLDLTAKQILIKVISRHRLSPLYQRRKFTAIHMRGGDYLKIPEYGILSQEYFLEILNHAPFPTNH